MRQFSKYCYSLLVVVLLSGALYAIMRADSNEIEGRLPKVRPDGVICQPVDDGIADYEEVNNEAGITYYGGWPVTATLPISAPFRLSFWDADGAPKTVATLYDRGSVVSTHDFLTGDNKWSDWVTVTARVDTIHIQTPDDHKSTSLCLYQSSNITATPPAEQTPPSTPTTEITPTITPPATITLTPWVTPTPTAMITATPPGDGGGGDVPPPTDSSVPTNEIEVKEPGHKLYVPLVAL